MRILENLEPARPLYYFEEISNIPRGSGNTKQISDYCVNFAKEHNLKYIQDDLNDIIIFKEASKGYENAEPIIIQGHMDMVCEKEKNCDINFEKEGVRLAVEDDFIFAKGTTLGGDDGVAVAYALALLEDDTLKHPKLEVVFTIDEETGMTGARNIDLSMLEGKRLLNIDSEDDGVLWISCAGGRNSHVSIPVSRKEFHGVECILSIEGLEGGHSGAEIDKGHGNSNIIMGRVLHELNKNVDYTILKLAGGLKDNAIPVETVCSIIIEETQLKNVETLLQQFDKVLKNEYRASDAGVRIEFLAREKGKYDALDKESCKNVIFTLMEIPNGIASMSMEIDELVETSCNLGILKLEDKEMKMVISVRSSVSSRKEMLSDKIKLLAEHFNGTYTIEGDYPAWEYNSDSKLREEMMKIYKEKYKKEMKIKAIHAGLECGLLSTKIKDLDCVSFGPDIFDIHTPKERMSISSFKNVWEYILEILNII